MWTLAPAPPGAHLPRRSEAGGKGALVVLLLAERAPSEGPRSTRAIEDQPSHLLENKRASLGGPLSVKRVRVWNQAPPLWRKLLDAACFLESMETGSVAYRPVKIF